MKTKKILSIIVVVFGILLLGGIYVASDFGRYIALGDNGGAGGSEEKAVHHLGKEELDLLKTCEHELANNKIFSFTEATHNFSEAKDEYHTLINCIINEVVKKLEKSVEKSLDAKKKCMTKKSLSELLKATKIADIETIGEKKTPVGLAFLLMRAYREYDSFLTDLDYKMKIDADDEVGMSTFEAAQRRLAVNRNNIEKEREKALKAIEISLLAYNEMRTTYPLHKRYECIIEHLEEYRQTIAAIRAYTECLPAKFPNARTSQD